MYSVCDSVYLRFEIVVGDEYSLHGGRRRGVRGVRCVRVACVGAAVALRLALRQRAAAAAAAARAATRTASAPRTYKVIHIDILAHLFYMITEDTRLISFLKIPCSTDANSVYL